MATYHQWMEVVTPATLAGLPALSVPVGFSDAGLPMGMQLSGGAATTSGCCSWRRPITGRPTGRGGGRRGFSGLKCRGSVSAAEAAL